MTVLAPGPTAPQPLSSPGRSARRPAHAPRTSPPVSLLLTFSQFFPKFLSFSQNFSVFLTVFSLFLVTSRYGSILSFHRRSRSSLFSLRALRFAVFASLVAITSLPLWSRLALPLHCHLIFRRPTETHGDLRRVTAFSGVPAPWQARAPRRPHKRLSDFGLPSVLRPSDLGRLWEAGSRAPASVLWTLSLLALQVNDPADSLKGIAFETVVHVNQAPGLGPAANRFLNQFRPGSPAFGVGILDL